MQPQYFLHRTALSTAPDGSERQIKAHPTKERMVGRARNSQIVPAAPPMAAALYRLVCAKYIPPNHYPWYAYQSGRPPLARKTCVTPIAAQSAGPPSACAENLQAQRIAPGAGLVLRRINQTVHPHLPIFVRSCFLDIVLSTRWRASPEEDANDRKGKEGEGGKDDEACLRVPPTAFPALIKSDLRHLPFSGIESVNGDVQHWQIALLCSASLFLVSHANRVMLVTVVIVGMIPPVSVLWLEMVVVESIVWDEASSPAARARGLPQDHNRSHAAKILANDVCDIR